MCVVYCGAAGGARERSEQRATGESSKLIGCGPHSVKNENRAYEISVEKLDSGAITRKHIGISHVQAQ